MSFKRWVSLLLCVVGRHKRIKGEMGWCNKGAVTIYYCARCYSTGVEGL
jgi:hypothetical protein